MPIAQRKLLQFGFINMDEHKGETQLDMLAEWIDRSKELVAEALKAQNKINFDIYNRIVKPWLK